MIELKNITIKNFMSIGNSTQAVNLNRTDLTLVLGENLDLGSNGSRNGVGKTSLINALSYALYGSALTNIKKPNLINKTNIKNMLVSIDFTKDNKAYRIERGRKPNVLRFFINNEEHTEEDDAQGDSRDTQHMITSVLGLSHAMFKHIVALNTYTVPFLNLSVKDQREIIEELMGITLLSEKALILRDEIKESKDVIKKEEIVIATINNTNAKIQEQIKSIKLSETAWNTSNDDTIASLSNDIKDLQSIDIDGEINKHSLVDEWNIEQDELKQILSVKLEEYNQLTDQLQKLYIDDLAEYNNVKDLHQTQFNDELENYNTLYRNEVDVHNAIITELQSTYTDQLQEFETHESMLNVYKYKHNELEILNQQKSEVSNNIAITQGNKCPLCKQDVGDHNHTNLLKKLTDELNIIKDKTNTLSDAISELEITIADTNEVIRPDEPILPELISELTKPTLTALGVDMPTLAKPKINKPVLGDAKPKPITLYDTLKQALEHKNLLNNTQVKLAVKEKESNPYTVQIVDMETNLMQKINYDIINETSMLVDHQDFLLKLLTNKDSFVRKFIIEQNLSYLNSRLSYYTSKIGLHQQVNFINDLSVEITDLGRDLDFDNLSRGERNRVILSLSWAFRDVWENLYTPINTLFIDEVIDSGMDAIGVENSLSILKEMSRDRKKSVWLISHKDELASRVNNVLTVVKEDGFTMFNTDTK
jgi:DNA repair exonuclease SbcCD ATPase subunit